MAKRIFFLIIFSFSLFAQDSDIKTSDNPYGLTHDGSNFWYIDSRQRSIYRIDENGNRERFNLNIPGLTGIHFDPVEGRIFAAAGSKVYKIHPVTGKITDRIFLPLKNIRGLATHQGIIYLLGKDDGKVHFYDQGAKMMVGGFFSDLANPRDITLGRNSIWISEADNGNIFRYDPKSGKITGSIKAPAREVRGLVFTGARLWVVDSENKVVKNLSFMETDRFIASNENKLKVTVSLSFNLDAKSLGFAEIAVIPPPTTEYQRVREIEFKNPDFTSDFLFGKIGYVKKLSIDDLKIGHKAEFTFSLITYDLRYFINDDYYSSHEPIPGDIITYSQAADKANDRSIKDYTGKLYDNRIYRKNFSDLYQKLNDYGFPVRSAINYSVDTLQRETVFHPYLKSYGWIPLDSVPLKSGESSRYFTRNNNSFDLVFSNGNEEIISPVFFRENPQAEWKNIKAEIKITAEKD